MAHVWQYQNGGLAYIPLSLIAQFGASRLGRRSQRGVQLAGGPPARHAMGAWNPEQQASAVEDYNKLLRLAKEGTA